MNWFGAHRARVYLSLLATVNVVVVIFLVATSRHGVDRNGFLLGTDFLSFWTAGHMLEAGANPYDVAAHIAAQQRYFTAPHSYTAFFYPPTFLPLCAPLGWLPYFPALVAWLMATGAGYLAVARLWLQALAVNWPLWLLALAFPPVVVTLSHGQTAFLVAALLGLGTLWVGPRPVLAGVCFGLATIKPQFGLLVPLVLLITREWRVIVAAGATAALLGLAATAALGPHVWSDWLVVSREAQGVLEQGAVGFAKMASPFAAARLLGWSIPLAYGVQIVVAAGVASALAWAGWRRPYTLALGAAMLAGAPLVTPFVLDYDLVLLAFPLIWLAGQTFRPWEKLIAGLAFIIALFARSAGEHLGAPLVPLVLIPLFAILVARARGLGVDQVRV
ncbi:MAG: glycosyltransferase family 87 protein [Croceibacterium sp.]